MSTQTKSSDSELPEVISALRRSHERLAATVSALTAEQISAPSYCSQWSIAQVLSHLGSGAEIFTQFLDAGLRGQPAPGVEQFQPVWDRWDAKDPEQQAHDAVRRDAAFLNQVDALDAAQRDRWRLSMFGGEQDLAGLGRPRLGEHALHTWDVAVVLDTDATVASDAVALLIDGLDQIVTSAGRSRGESLRVLVATDAPERRFLLEVDPEGARLGPADTNEDGAATLRLPAEAFARLVYGRLDPRHTKSVETTRVDLDALRQSFPGV